MRLDYRLGEGSRRSQFVALAADVEHGLPPFRAVRFVGRASRPMRVSVQIRFPGPGEPRWGRSAYLDDQPRTVSVGVDEMVSMDRQGSPMPAPETARSVLLVIDLTNARPGDTATMEIGGLVFVAR
jgi:hypothetical protein